MKPRRVIVCIEMTSSDSLAELRRLDLWKRSMVLLEGEEVHQVQVNVIKVERAAARKRTKRG